MPRPAARPSSASSSASSSSPDPPSSPPPTLAAETPAPPASPDAPRPAPGPRTPLHTSVSLPHFSPPRVVFSYDAKLLDEVLRAQLLHERCVGLDIEWRPTFISGAPQHRVALVQVCSPRVCVLVPVRHVPLRKLPSLVALLEQPTTWKVGCGVREDARKLHRDLGVVCAPVLELGDSATRLQGEGSVRFPGLPEDEAVRPGIKGMALACGVQLSKPKSLSRSNWERRPLTQQQQIYASQDAYVGLWLSVCLHRLATGGSVDFREWLAEQAARESASQTAKVAEREQRLKEWGVGGSATPGCFAPHLDARACIREIA
ncbi:hypothetical protein AB1Y20_012512 [Prymnesium parvum]|uniref:3'-5' exonuclease n=1 Tax=Prymnesium parvum TaxID=97485 RepID=A0AB34IKS0_PRYPA